MKKKNVFLNNLKFMSLDDRKLEWRWIDFSFIFVLELYLLVECILGKNLKWIWYGD